METQRRRAEEVSGKIENFIVLISFLEGFDYPVTSTICKAQSLYFSQKISIQIELKLNAKVSFQRSCSDTTSIRRLQTSIVYFQWLFISCRNGKSFSCFFTTTRRTLGRDVFRYSTNLISISNERHSMLVLSYCYDFIVSDMEMCFALTSTSSSLSSLCVLLPCDFLIAPQTKSALSQTGKS